MRLPRLIRLLAASLAAVSCRTPAEPDRTAEPAVLIHYGETSHVFAPDTVARGVPFEVRFVTFGGGCTRAIAETHVVVAPREITVHPYNWRQAGEICTKDLGYLMHRAMVRVAEPGAVTIRVRGERRGSPPYSHVGPVELTRQLVVR